MSHIALTTMLLGWLLEILFLCESLHIRENRFAPALGKNFMGTRVCTHSVLLTVQTLTCSLPFFVAGIIPDLPWINSLILVMSHKPIIVGDMAGCTRVSNPGIPCTGIKGVTINGAHHTNLVGLSYIFHELFYIIFFIFCCP